ncbi:uncharacterized protein MYCFIDRAFT_208161 [Pseudocercospora fijiensis CIRAD86]|uniref:Uncharacterized protein n=1 Tax=Pseudocercospora fijiensis (strain CIRAD86) TaxID=383855 RepID=M2ZNW0_PSEFD|nr:uncharacterized protein MYCFIDRAFT_208161 [Pseudocercospora fijiensis CIRAD86]EME80759.1 hypothetical protein MYCFIDRAFT_208161 [Pseudocercospora fijiensis CIRAD86]
MQRHLHRKDLKNLGRTSWARINPAPVTVFTISLATRSLRRIIPLANSLTPLFPTVPQPYLTPRPPPGLSGISRKTCEHTPYTFGIALPHLKHRKKKKKRMQLSNHPPNLPPPSSPHQNPEEDSTAITKIIHTICSGLSTKHFDPNDPKYTDIISFENFTATITSPVCLERMNFTGFMNACAEVVRTCPEWQGAIHSIEAFIDLRTAGEHPGVWENGGAEYYGGDGLLALMGMGNWDGGWMDWGGSEVEICLTLSFNSQLSSKVIGCKPPRQRKVPYRPSLPILRTNERTTSMIVLFKKVSAEVWLRVHLILEARDELVFYILLTQDVNVVPMLNRFYGILTMQMARSSGERIASRAHRHDESLFIPIFFPIQERKVSHSL